MSPFEILLLVFNGAIFVWVAIYRPWKIGQRREAAIQLIRGGAARPESEWRWSGHAAHFALADRCHWHLTTRVGRYIISSIGDLENREETGQRLTLGGAGNDKDYAMYYETMVFSATGPEFQNSGHEIAGRRYETPEEATEGHFAMCHKYAEIEP